jgi:hypothetical protein
MSTVLEYLNLITSEHRQKPRFTAMVQVGAGASVHVQDLLDAMIPLFDVDLAEGQQLDVLGQWVGISRDIPIPIPGLYFSWDQPSDLGWDFGIWRPFNEPTEITSLPDDVYRTFIKAKIAANKWDGSLINMYEVWDSVFTDITIFIVDNQDMSYNIGFQGRPVDSLTLALIQQGYLPLKPEGVRVNVIYSPVDSGKMFSWDVDNTLFGGWDESSWAKEI